MLIDCGEAMSESQGRRQNVSYGEEEGEGEQEEKYSVWSVESQCRGLRIGSFKCRKKVEQESCTVSN